MTEISADTRMQLEPGGRLVVIYLKSGDRVHVQRTGADSVRRRRPAGNERRAAAEAREPGRQGRITIKPAAVRRPLS